MITDKDWEEYSDEEHEDRENIWECPCCGTENSHLHVIGCPEDDGPFARLIRDGYD